MALQIIFKSSSSGIVYKYSCGCCNVTRIGKTMRYLNVRASDHLGVPHLTGRRVAICHNSRIGDHLLQSVLDNFVVLPSEPVNYILEIFLYKKRKRISIEI